MFSAGGTQAWVPDADYILTAVGKGATAAGVLISTNPSYATTDYSAPAATKNVFDILTFIQSGVTFMTGLNIPILSADKIYLVSGGVQAVSLYLESGTAET